MTKDVNTTAPHDGGSREEDLARDIGALIDGEIDQETEIALEKQLFRDQKARQLFRRMAEDDARLKAAFAEDGPLPAELEAAIDRGFDARRRYAGFTGMFRSGWAQAAAFILVAGGAGLATMTYMNARIDATLAQFAAMAETERQTMSDALQVVLETQSSGRSVNLVDFGGHEGSVTPVRTYKSTSGHWCRDYVHDVQLGNRRYAVLGVACRSASGEWVTVRAKAGQPAPSSGI